MFCKVFSEQKSASPKKQLGESIWSRFLIFSRFCPEKEPNRLRQSSQNSFLDDCCKISMNMVSYRKLQI